MKGPLRVGRDISFNTKGVTGWWRGERSGVQILSAPEGAPRANEGADNPFILEFPIQDAGVWPITNQRRRREHQKLTLLLNFLLAGTTKFLGERPKQFWTAVNLGVSLNSSGRGKCTSQTLGRSWSRNFRHQSARKLRRLTRNNITKKLEVLMGAASAFQMTSMN
jgi:hypothetical protein